MKTEYKTISRQYTEDFDAAVTQALADGWALFKGPYSLTEQDKGYFCQALIRQVPPHFPAVSTLPGELGVRIN